MNKSLSVVVPTFNERENIQVLVPRILDVFLKNGIDGEIIIVEDPSTDGSDVVLRELEEKHQGVHVIFRKPPCCLSKAWHDGFMASSKAFVVCIDADLCHDPGCFPEMIEKMADFDLVIGSRYIGRGHKAMEDKSQFVLLCSKLGQYSSRLVFGFKAKDTSHSFRMFKKDLFNRIADNLDQEGNVYLVQFLYEAEKAGARVTEIPIVYGKRIYGETKLMVTKETVRYFKFVFSTLIRRLKGCL